VLVALAGQPNVGKSTVFNILTGLSQHVGNWPGKTVEKKEGSHVAEGVELRIVDLPGTYSLTAFSEEERVAREFIIQSRPASPCCSSTRLRWRGASISFRAASSETRHRRPQFAGRRGCPGDLHRRRRAARSCVPVVSMVATKNTGSGSSSQGHRRRRRKGSLPAPPPRFSRPPGDHTV